MSTRRGSFGWAYKRLAEGLPTAYPRGGHTGVRGKEGAGLDSARRYAVGRTLFHGATAPLWGGGAWNDLFSKIVNQRQHAGIGGREGGGSWRWASLRLEMMLGLGGSGPFK